LPKFPWLVFGWSKGSTKEWRIHATGASFVSQRQFEPFWEVDLT